MRRKANQSHVGFTARIDADDRVRLDSTLPMTGGKTWAVQEALEYFCALCEGDASLQTLVHDKVLEMRAGEPPRRQDELVPLVPRDLYNRFNKMFGEKGATTWFLRRFVAEFNHAATQHAGLQDDVRQAVRAILTP